MLANELSKAEMARSLVSRGAAKSFHTLRKLPAATLQVMLAETTTAAPDDKPEPACISLPVAAPMPVAEIAPPVAMPAPAPVSVAVREERRPGTWLGLAYQPFAFVFGLLGL